MINEKNISIVLRKLGVPPSLTGFEYILTSIKLIDEDKYYCYHTWELYHEVANRHNTTHIRCERCIRHAVEISFKYGGLKAIEEVFGSAYDSTKGKPTNSEFLACLYEYLRYEK